MHFFALALIFFLLPLSVFAKDSFFGVHGDFVWDVAFGEGREADLLFMNNRLEEMNIGAVRMPIRWNVLYGDLNGIGPGVTCENLQIIPWNVDDVRRVIDALPNDVEIIGYLGSPPDVCKSVYGWSPVYFGELYAEYVREAVHLFKDRIHTWEVWNEPNNNHFYYQPPYAVGWSAWDYVAHVALPGSRAIREADPSAEVILGSFVYNGVLGHPGPQQPPTSPFSGQWYVIPNFIDTMFNALQALGTQPFQEYYDAIAAHPYYYQPLGSAPGQYVWPHTQTHGVNGTSAVMSQKGDTSSPIYWTEYGETVSASVSERQQATNLQHVLSQAVLHRTHAHPLKGIFWYTWRDGFGAPGYGLIEGGTNRPREAFFTMKHGIAQRTSISSIIDTFRQPDAVGNPYDRRLWTESCTSSGRLIPCGTAFFRDNTPPTASVLMRPPAGSWTQSQLTSQYEIPLRDAEALHLEYLSNIFNNNPTSNELYTNVDIGPRTSLSIRTPRPNVRITLRRISDSEVSFAIEDKSRNIFLSPWQSVVCEDANYTWFMKVQSSFYRDGSWDFSLRDSYGKECVRITRGTGPNHTLSFSTLGKTGIAMQGLSRYGATGFVKFSNIYLSTNERLQDVYVQP